MSKDADEIIRSSFNTRVNIELNEPFCLVYKSTFCRDLEILEWKMPEIEDLENCTGSSSVFPVIKVSTDVRVKESSIFSSRSSR